MSGTFRGVGVVAKDSHLGLQMDPPSDYFVVAESVCLAVLRRQKSHLDVDCS